MPLVKLNARQEDAAKSGKEACRLAGGAGLYLEVVFISSIKYRFNGKEKRMVFGVYPAVSFAQARALRDGARKKRVEDIAPSFARKEEKLACDVSHSNVLQTVALE